MRRSSLFVLLVVAAAFMTVDAGAKNTTKVSPKFDQAVSPGELSAALSLGDGTAYRSAAQSTTYLASYTFDSGPACVTEGWTTEDLTAQIQEFFHVDDFAGLGGGTFGLLAAPAGLQALWCGARSSGTAPLCSYASLPGYGNLWDQAFCTKSAVAGSGISVNFAIHWDTEPGYDFVRLEVDDATVGGENWLDLGAGPGTGGAWDAQGTDTTSVAIPDSLHGGSVNVRWHFTSDGAWSDEDGLWDTDGALILDDLSVSVTSGGSGLPVEDFEAEAVGATSSSDWEACSPSGYGDFAALFPGAQLVQEDPCLSRVSCMWGFFSGSSFVYDCVTPQFLTQPVVPYGNAQGQYMNNYAISPVIPWVGSGTGAEMVFDVYRDLPLDNLVFYVWNVRSIVAGCPTPWVNRNLVSFGGGKDWLNQVNPFGDLVVPGATDIQVSVGCVDQCGVWCGIFGTGSCHSHAPLIDNIDVYRIATTGPQWSGRDIDQLQDNFEEISGPTAGTARADAAQDILPSTNPNILPGDSAVVTVSDPVLGLAGDVTSGFGPAVYLYATVFPQGQPGKSGAALSDDSFRYPVVGSTVADGLTWDIVRLDTAFVNGATRTGVTADVYCIDLNDNLFEAGDTVLFFYGAENTNGERTYFRVNAGAGLSFNNIDEAAANADEFTILPAGGVNNGGDILFVDGMNFRGAQPFFDSSFENLGLLDQVDRYDVRAPSSSIANRLGSRVNDVSTQLIGNYRKIIWNTGNLDQTIGDGTGNPEKSDDASVLFSFLEQLPNTGGLYLNGDDLPDQMKQATGVGMVSLLSKYINYNLDDPNHVTYGTGASPLMVGDGGGFLAGDTLVAYGGCVLINDFDVISAAGAATQAGTYSGNGTTGGAMVAQTTLNPNGFNVGVVLSGFSFHYVRDDRPAGVPDRFVHMQKILQYLNNTPGVATGTGTAAQTSLSQNYPNPFNPTTTINYTLRDRSNVSLKVYNVKGQLVRTLVNGVLDPAQVAPVTWNGLNDRGQQVSSGVYFYKLVTRDFTQTKKMVLLK